MNGVMVISLESGMVLHYLEIVQSFGLSTLCDPFQQCGFLYALYSSASAQFSSQERGYTLPSLQWFTQDNVMWHFHEGIRSFADAGLREKGAGECTVNGEQKVLIALSTNVDVSPSTAQRVAAGLSQLFFLSSISHTSSSKPSVAEKLNRDILDVISLEVCRAFCDGVLAHAPSDTLSVFMCQRAAISVEHTAHTLSADLNTIPPLDVDSKLNKAFTEWKNKSGDSGQASSVNHESAHSIDLSTAADKNSSLPVTETLFPPIAPSKVGFLDAVKGMFLKKKSGSGGRSTVEKTNRVAEAEEVKSFETNKHVQWLHFKRQHAAIGGDIREIGGSAANSAVSDTTVTGDDRNSKIGKNISVEDSSSFHCSALSPHLCSALTSILSMPSGMHITLSSTKGEITSESFLDFLDNFNGNFVEEVTDQGSLAVRVNDTDGLEGDAGKGEGGSSAYFLTCFDLAGVKAVFLQSTTQGTEEDGPNLINFMLRDHPLSNAMQEFVALSSTWP